MFRCRAGGARVASRDPLAQGPPMTPATPGVPASPASRSAAALGLYPLAGWRITTGDAPDGPALRQARWYFRAETVAVPAAGHPVAGFAPGVRAFADLREWAARRADDAPPDWPPLAWIAAPDVLRQARLSPDASALKVGGATLACRLVPKHPLNRSYFDAASAAFLAARSLSVRGTTTADGFVARTFWPEDFRLTAAAPDRALPRARSAATALRQLIREAPSGGAASPYVAQTLWRRDAGDADWTGRAVLAFVLNGAQGDDDEAHGGHFALATGRVGADGAIGDWLVNSFYTLDSESEKGILAAPVPLDNYLGDLNAGQAWYRPSYLLVAVLAAPRAAELVQSALGRVYNQFYRHQLTYYHPDQNCTSFSVDTLRTLGWRVRARGATSRVLGVLGFPLIALKERSFAKARLSFDYLNTDQTRMLPAAAFEEIFAGLWHELRGSRRHRGRLATMLAQDLTALAWLRVPQIPSSRAMGTAPAVTTREYRTRVPADPAQAQVVPVPPRPFPAALRDPDLLPPQRPPSDAVALAWGALSIVGLPWVARTLWQRWRPGRRG
jgi:hypothetical protein